MKITIPVTIDIDPTQFQAIRSPLVKTLVEGVDADGNAVQTPVSMGDRECWLDLYSGRFAGIELASTNGVNLTMDMRIRGAVKFTRYEAATVLGITEEDVAAMPAETVENDAPFTAVVLGKIIAAVKATVEG